MLQQITSLRGLAIILIVLFHLAPQYFPNGYFGVEVFLVISGYLLMRSDRRQQGQFRPLEFAQKKLMRLYVPVTVTILLTLAAGVFIMDYTDTERASGTALATLLVYANSYLGRQAADYFAPDSSYNPLLHMWYLAVTIHIYLFFAAACLLRRYIPQRVMVALLWGVGIASFLWAYSYPIHNALQALGLPAWKQSSGVSHYLTLPRLWEPLAGVWLACLPPVCENRKWRNTALLLLGLCGILIPSLLRETNLVGASLSAVVGTCLVIRYATPGLLTTILNNRLLIWVGSISFSLYLVHMPLIAYWHSCHLSAPDMRGIIILLAASLVLGYVFYLLVEKRAISWKLFLGLFVAALALSIFGKESDGFKKLINRELNMAEPTLLHHSAEASSPGIYDQFDKKAMPFFNYVFHYTCKDDFTGSDTPLLVHMGVPGKEPSIVLFGDSHANAVFTGLDTVLRPLDASGVFLTSIVIPFWDWELPELGAGSNYSCNRNKVEALLCWLRAHPHITHVVIAHNWNARYSTPRHPDWNLKTQTSSPEHYKESLRTFINEMRAAGKEVILLGPLPSIKHKDVGKVARLSIRHKLFSEEDNAPPGLSYSREEYYEEQKHVLPILKSLEQEGICTLLNLETYIPEQYPLNLYNNGKLLYTDSLHMSVEGAQKLFHFLTPQLREALKKKPAAAAAGN